MTDSNNLLIRQGKICPYCQGDTEYVQSSNIYARDYGMIYLCRPCDAWVGVHEGSNKAKGRLANAELREWRIKAHLSFDRLWKRHLNQGIAKHRIRNGTYHWLAEQMGIDQQELHIGMFDVDQCKRAILICDDFYSSGGQVQFKKDLQPVIQIHPHNINMAGDTDLPGYKESRIIRQETTREIMLKWCLAKNVSAFEIQPYQLRLVANDKKIDIFPQSRKFHNIVSNIRGRYRDIIVFLDSEFAGKG